MSFSTIYPHLGEGWIQAITWSSRGAWVAQRFSAANELCLGQGFSP